MNSLDLQTESLDAILPDKDLRSLEIERKIIYKFKVCLIGEIAVGKTSIIERYITGRFNSEYNCTCGTEFRLKTVSKEGLGSAEISIWDTAGGEKYRSITKSYFRDAQGIVVVFDLTNRLSFNTLETWINEVRDTVGNESVIVVVGNKMDLNEKRKVSDSEIEEFVDRMNLKYFEASAKDGVNIDEVFQYLTEEVLEKIARKEIIITQKKKLHKKKKVEPQNECACWI